jgi:TetR/AcrR family transcriptional repressor of mexJK operon
MHGSYDGLPDTPGRKRRNAMIEAAYQLFTERGYASVSVDDIIRVSKGSKSSFYKFFGNKEGLLKAVITALAGDMLREIHLEFPDSRTPREALNRLGMVLVDLALSENAINQHRHAVSHAKAFPDVARLWYESGPKTTFDGLAEFMRKETAAGRLRVANPDRAALFFAGMIIFHENMRLLVCLPPTKKSEMKKVVSEAVDVFLAAYGGGNTP